MVTRAIAKKATRSPRAKPLRQVPAPERMSPVDRAWLRMDSPANLMMILGVWLIKPGVDYAAVCQRLQERLLQYPRFGQRVTFGVQGAIWVAEEDFKIERHVVRELLPPGPKSREQQALQTRLAELAVRPLDAKHPLWQFHLVEHYKGGSALIARIHHCIADGVALIGVTQSMVDGGLVRRPPERAKPGKAADSEPASDWGGWVSDLLVSPQKTMESLLDKGVAGATGAGKIFSQALFDGASLAFMPDDSPTRLKGTPGPAKRVAWCQPLPLAEIKATAHALNCSINDVLMSCVAGAIGAYLRACGDDIGGLEIRAMVPVNLRQPEDEGTLGNRFGLAPVVLPIGMDNPVERLYEVRRRMRAMKQSYQPLLTLGLLTAAGWMVQAGQDALLGLFSKKTTAVLTNVPGPREKLRFLGSTLEQDLVWVPQYGTVGLGISILSYGGGVQFGIISDAGLCPEPQKIIDKFEPEFAKLSYLALMLPWSE